MMVSHLVRRWSVTVEESLRRRWQVVVDESNRLGKGLGWAYEQFTKKGLEVLPEK